MTTPRRHNMYRKRWVCLGVSIFFFILFLILGIVGPILVDKQLQSQVNDQMIMKESNADTWGLCPGHTRVHLNREFFFFNVTNPDGIMWRGERPCIEQLFEPYKYLEVDHYMERVFDTDPDSGLEYVRFRRYTWYNKTDDWASNISPTDYITQINIGSISAWDQMKHLPPETVAVAALYSIVSGLDSIMLVTAVAQGIFEVLFQLSALQQNFQSEVWGPAMISTEVGQAMWSDAMYGWGSLNSFPIWVQAEMQCFQGDECDYHLVSGGAIFLLKEYFGLSDDQMESVLTGWLQNSYNSMGLILGDVFGCQTTFCDPHYLTALQWSQQGVSNNPPTPQIPAVPSVALLNSTIGGYPEISYFRDNYYTADSPLRKVKFSVSDALRLLDYNLGTGWPSGSNHTLLDVGHMNQFFALGRLGDFTGIATLLDLTSVAHAEVLFDYINELVAVTALQGRTDQNTYNADNRGLTNELSLGNLLSQTMSQLFYGISQALAVELTARYAFAVMKNDPKQKTDCKTVLKNCGVSTDICDTQTLGWNEPSSLDIWILTYWNGDNSPYWQQFKIYSGFQQDTMYALFGPKTFLTTLFSGIDASLHTHYSCRNQGVRCTHYELYIQQWAQSSISLGLPTIMGTIGMKNGTSLIDWGDPFDGLLPAPFEYYAYLQTNNIKDPNAYLSYEVAAFLLNPMVLLNQVECQRYFTYIFDQEVRQLNMSTKIYTQYQIKNIAVFTDYLRKTVNKFALGDLFITQTVDEWLWTGTNSLLIQVANTNPLQGGNPAVNPTQVQLGQNTTRASLRFPDHYKHAMITGKQHVESKLRWWYLFYGNPNVTLYTQVYSGHTPEGPIITYQNLQVWAVEQPIMGGDALNFQTNIDSHSAVWLYLDPFLRFGQGSFDRTLTISDMNVYRYMVSNDLVGNYQDNPENAIYYCYGPSGVANITPVTQGPMFIGKPYFFGGESDKLLGVLNITTPYSEDLSVYDSYFDLEHYTGAVFSEEEKIMTVVELRGDALYPNLGLNGYKEEGIWTYLPIFFMNRSSYYPNDRVIPTQINFLFGQIKTAMDLLKWIQIVGLLLASIFFVVAAGISLWLFYAKRAASLLKSSPIVQETQDKLFASSD